MNEKIKELIKQATVFEYDELFNLERDRFDKEKFAELIVKECIEVVEKQKVKMSYGPTFVIQDIKEHFGVEE
jgi:hypothetical protein